MEEWKSIPGTNNKIEVSNYGRARSLLRGEPYILKCQPDKKGYLRLRVTIERNKKSYRVHREVAKAFIPNPNNLPQVNHIDGNKNNNSVSNLEWATNRANAIHAINNGLWESVMQGALKANEAKQKPVIATKDDKSLQFKSISEAERYFDSRHICDVLKGKRNHVKGWSFAYGKGVMS